MNPVFFLQKTGGDERRVATISFLLWARVGHCTSMVQYGALLHRTSTAAHSRPRSATVFPATHPRHTLLFLTLSPMGYCIKYNGACYKVRKRWRLWAKFCSCTLLPSPGRNLLALFQQCALDVLFLLPSRAILFNLGLVLSCRHPAAT